MSRLVQAKPAPAAKRPGGGGITSKDDTCPVCKTSRYLKPDLKLLVNPECYHKMCVEDVNKYFAHGPNNCPVPGCKRTLRKHRFREQTFEDIKVEREVDIRKKVAQVFNKREEDFEDLRTYNDYLNDVEDVTFNLVEGIDVEESNKRLEAYRKLHADEIAANQSLAADQSNSYHALQKQEREQARLRREAARREEEEERREQAEIRRETLERLATGKEDPETVTREAQQVQLKRGLDRKAKEERSRRLQAASETQNGSSDLVIKGLKQRKEPVPEAPIDPFGGLSLDGRQYYAVQDQYVWDVIKGAEKDAGLRAGGYNTFEQFGGRALCEAFSGLGVFVADEKTESEKAGQDDDVQGTRRAEVAAKDVKMEDPF